ncbi:guanylyl cyclase 1 [Zea mays]|uniref:Guanylyl cyclase 1 n=1 Tax=Zea mays TaxID=4577 RepID=A0A1D6J7F8_MAIZE|nr:guanylyl cyclase 1 [Zea mays]
MDFSCWQVPHVQQAFTWDYGLACVLMVLRTLGIDCCDGIADLERLCRTTSIWTVDLAYLLNKISVSFPFCTVTLGANPQYSAESFCREQLQEDIDRVDELFGKALDAGISIQATQPLEGCQYVGIHSIRIVCAFFGLGSKVAMFQYSSVEMYNACKPQPTLEIHNPDMHKDAPRYVYNTKFAGPYFIGKVYEDDHRHK